MRLQCRCGSIRTWILLGVPSIWAAGANAFVGKPIQEAALLQVIATLLRLEWLRERPKEQLGDS